ncbi:MAG: hypothetical protein RLZZ15_1155 [Verrucomicrobiota bacterium]|jgi:hypothetical protein
MAVRKLLRGPGRGLGGGIRRALARRELAAGGDAANTRANALARARTVAPLRREVARGMRSAKLARGVGLARAGQAHSALH